MTPNESDARKVIDQQLRDAGWSIQDYDGPVVRGAGAIAIREFPLSTGIADYLLVINSEAVGILEAKRTGTTLTGVKEQSTLYQAGSPTSLHPITFTRSPLPFSYEATDNEIFFTNELEPDPRSRPVFHFHRPEALERFLKDAPPGVSGISNRENDLLRSRVRRMPPLPRIDLRECQFEAITRLEASLAANHPRSLIQMATGSGKTYTTVSSVYRLIKYGKAKRILFLVDRNNLAKQTLNEFQQYVTPDDGRKFTELYNVQHLQGNSFDSVANVCITTIQRLYSMLTNQPVEEELEEESLFEQEEQDGERPPRKVSYNPHLPIEYFDVIFIDECHRSIYSEWRPVLEYFDAFLVGLTATPEQRAFAFFNRNLVTEYSQAQSVADGVNVDYEVYRIETEITKHGSKLERGTMVYRRHKQTRERTWEHLNDDLVYTGNHLDRDVVAKDQIRTVLATYRDTLFTEIFPGRTEVPKTLIFAKNDSHAEDIVQVVREVFGKGNDFAKKITYRVSGAKPEDLIRDFRNSYHPRIVVTVDMISTGTDIKPLEVLLFMRSIKSRTFFEQMKGRGCRIISDEDFQSVTPDAKSKTHFVLVDTVGVTDGLKADNPPLERKSSVSLESLLTKVGNGKAEDDDFVSLAGRLGRLTKRLQPEDIEKIHALTGTTLQELAQNLLNATDFDQQTARAQSIAGTDNPDLQTLKEAERQLQQEASQPFTNAELNNLLLQLQRRDKQILDDVSIDRVLSKGFSEDQARQTIASFRAVMEQHSDEITAFQIAFNKPSDVDLEDIVYRLARAIMPPNTGLTTDKVWNAYQKLESSRVRGAGTKRLLTDIIALIRYTIERETNSRAILEPYRDSVTRRFAAWLMEQEHTRQQPFTAEQLWWLERIRDRIAVDLRVEERDFDSAPFNTQGGRLGARRAFSGPQELQTLLQELNERLVA